MSYHLSVPRRVTARRLPQQPPVYPLYPLASIHPVPPGVSLSPLPSQDARERDVGRKILIGIVVVVVILAILAWLGEQERGVERNRGQERRVKRSTSQMAKDLYERLEGRSGVSETTMRSLAQLARGA